MCITHLGALVGKGRQGIARKESPRRSWVLIDLLCGAHRCRCNIVHAGNLRHRSVWLGGFALHRLSAIFVALVGEVEARLEGNTHERG